VALLVAMRLRPPLPPSPDLLRPSVPPLLGAGLAASVSDEYYSTHWLATFAWDAMESIEEGARAR
jgi:hypothetical protein